MKASGKHDIIHRPSEKEGSPRRQTYQVCDENGLFHTRSTNTKAGKYSNSVEWHVERRREFRTKTGRMWSGYNDKLYVVFNASTAWPAYIYDKQSGTWFRGRQSPLDHDVPFITEPVLPTAVMRQIVICGSYAEYVAWRVTHDSPDDYD